MGIGYSSIGFSEMVLILFVSIIYSLVYVIPIWRILKRTGYNPVLSFIALIPIMKIVALYYFAFSPWPNDTQLKKSE
jgi:hypothetical protein